MEGGLRKRLSRGCQEVEVERETSEIIHESFPIFLSFSLSLLSLAYRVVLDLFDVKKLLQARDLCLLHGRRRGGARVEEDLGRHSRVDRLVSRARELLPFGSVCFSLCLFYCSLEGETENTMPGCLWYCNRRERDGEVEREREKRKRSEDAGNESELKKEEEGKQL